MSSAPPQLYVAEPPASYLVLPPLVVDCSVMVAAMFEEPARDQAIALMSGKVLFAPGLLVHEMVNVAARKLRAGSPSATVRQALSDFGAQAIELRPTDPLAQFELALQRAMVARGALAQRLGPCFGHVFDGEVGHDTAPK